MKRFKLGEEMKNELGLGLGAEARAGRRDRASRKMGAEAEEGGASRSQEDGGRRRRRAAVGAAAQRQGRLLPSRVPERVRESLSLKWRIF